MIVYTYTMLHFFNRRVDVIALAAEIREQMARAGGLLERVELTKSLRKPDTCTIVFEESLTADEMLDLDNIVQAHKGNPLPPPPEETKSLWDHLRGA